jgi:hypothetical protein
VSAAARCREARLEVREDEPLPRRVAKRIHRHLGRQGRPRDEERRVHHTRIQAASMERGDETNRRHREGEIEASHVIGRGRLAELHEGTQPALEPWSVVVEGVESQAVRARQANDQLDRGVARTRAPEPHRLPSRALIEPRDLGTEIGEIGPPEVGMAACLHGSPQGRGLAGRRERAGAGRMRAPATPIAMTPARNSCLRMRLPPRRVLSHLHARDGSQNSKGLQ